MTSFSFFDYWSSFYILAVLVPSYMSTSFSNPRLTFCVRVVAVWVGFGCPQITSIIAHAFIVSDCFRCQVLLRPPIKLFLRQEDPLSRRSARQILDLLRSLKHL